MIDVPVSSTANGQVTTGNRWVEAISGASGKTIWRYDLPSHWFDLPAAAEVPADLRWYVGAYSGMSSGGRSSLNIGKHIARSPGQQERNGMHVYSPTPAVSISLAGRSLVACMAGTQLVQLDPKTGQEITSPFDLGVRVGRGSQWVDIDSDGSSELIFLEEVPTTTYPHIPTTKLHVWSVSQRQMLWSLTLDADWPRQPSWTVEASQWPLVVDLQSDGKYELLAPHHRSSQSRYAGQVGSDSMLGGNWC